MTLWLQNAIIQMFVCNEMIPKQAIKIYITHLEAEIYNLKK